MFTWGVILENRSKGPRRMIQARERSQVEMGYKLVTTAKNRGSAYWDPPWGMYLRIGFMGSEAEAFIYQLFLQLCPLLWRLPWGH